MSALQRGFSDSIYCIGELTTSDKGSKVRGCVVLIANNNSLSANIVTTEPTILINIRKLHQPALTELRQCQHQIIYQTKKMNWWTHVETTGIAIRLICKSQEQKWCLSGNSSQPSYLLYSVICWEFLTTQCFTIHFINFSEFFLHQSSLSALWHYK